MHNTDMTIRPITMNDRPLVEDFFAVMGEYSSSFFNVNRGNEKRILKFFDGTLENHVVWIATKEVEGKELMVGLVFLYHAHLLVPELGIAVRDGYHGQHIGTDMINFVKDYTHETGCGGMTLITAQTNFKGQRLYEHCGFQRQGVHTSGEFYYTLFYERG